MCPVCVEQREKEGREGRRGGEGGGDKCQYMCSKFKE